MKIILKTLPLLLLCIQLNGQNRKVLIEQFTNSGCPPCAINTPQVASYVNTNLNDVLMLAYHTSFPYFDSMYHENAQQSDDRVAYYNIGAVPYSKADGNYFSGNIAPVINSVVNSRLNDIPGYTISLTNITISNHQLSATITCTSADNYLSSDLRLHAVIAEKNVLKSSYVCCAGNNTETEYPWVVRRMLPGSSGTTLINKYMGGSDVIIFNETLSNIKDEQEVRLVVFVQNHMTKEVLQSEIAVPLIVTNTDEHQNNKFKIVNPVADNTILLFSPEVISATVEVADLSGKIVLSEKRKIGYGLNKINVSVLPGVYILSIHDSSESNIYKINVQ